MPPIAPFSISRIFNAPRKLVWEVQTEPAHLAKYMGEGWNSVKFEFKVGGTHHYTMGTGAQQMWGRAVYREIVPMAKVVHLQSFSNAEGEIAPHPMAATWPREMLATTLFEDAGPGKTKLTVIWEPHNSDEAGNATFDGARAGMSGGWGQSFDTMEKYLNTLV